MKTAVKKTISLPPELAREAEEIARSEGKTVSAVIQDALRNRRAERLKAEFKSLRDYGRRKAKEKGIRTEADLERYLAK
jgi:metal-responsive CopG/Arc/MetJ family transcriptional regulator